MSYIRSKKINSIDRTNTNTSLFLIPGLGLKVDYLRTQFGFINGYLHDLDSPFQYNNPVFLLFLPPDEYSRENLEVFIEREYKKKQELVDDYWYEEYRVIVYEFPEKWLSEWELFFNGEYSSFRKKYVDLLPQEEHKEDIHGPYTEPSIQFNVCNRKAILKNYWEREIGEKLDPEGEYWSIPDMRDETLNIEKIKNDSRTNQKDMGRVPQE